MKKNIKVRPDILDQADAISIVKENKTIVDYFLFDTFEIHKNLVPAGCVQDWHQHKMIEEIIFINSGSLLLEWMDAGDKKKLVKTGEIIRMNNSIHRISNLGSFDAEFIVFRFVSPNKDQSNIIKADKKVYTDEEIEVLKKINKEEHER